MGVVGWAAPGCARAGRVQVVRRVARKPKGGSALRGDDHTHLTGRDKYGQRYAGMVSIFCFEGKSVRGRRAREHRLA